MDQIASQGVSEHDEGIKKNISSHAAHIYGIFYGGIIAGSYLTIKELTQDLYFQYFTLSSVFLAVVTGFSIRGPIPQGFVGICIRGLLYAATNFLILASQHKSSVSSSLTAALIGSLCVSIPSLIRRPIRTKNLVIILFASFGVYFLYDRIKFSYLAFFSGLIQALTFITASKLMRIHQTSIRWNLFVGFIIVAIVGFAFSSMNNMDLSITHLKPYNVLAVSVVVLISQTSFFCLYRSVNVESAARFSLGRIPWAFGIEMVISHHFLPIKTLIGATFIVLASFTKSKAVIDLNKK